MGSTGAINIPVDDLWHCMLSSDLVAWSSDTYTCAKATDLGNHYKVSSSSIEFHYPSSSPVPVPNFNFAPYIKNHF